MARYFKSKKIIRKNALIKFVIIIIIIYFTIRFSIFFLLKTKLYTFIYKQDKISSYIEMLANKTINNPVVLLSYHNYQTPKVVEVEQEKVDEVVIQEEIIKPKVYIYNSHQTESYQENTSTVLSASYWLGDALNKNNIEVSVEEGDINDFLITNNMDYSYSYVASRYFIEENILKNNYDLIIDLHRDALPREASVINIEGVNYAKILFVVGREHENYQMNLDLANTLNNLISLKYPYLSRGVMLKSGPGVNGLYNQDLSSNMILLELGGNLNTTDEVNNTINLIAPILGEYLNAKKHS